MLDQFRILLLVVAFAGTLSDAAQGQQGAVRPPWTTSRIQGAPVPPEPYKIVSVFPRLRFDKPTSIEELGGEDRLLVTERDGRVCTFSKDAQVTQADLVLDLRQWLPTEVSGQNVSLWDAELHPRFTENRQLYLCYVHPAGGGHTRLSRVTLTNEATPKAGAGSEQVILTWPSGGHNAGCLEFGADGFLYIATGDGTGPNPPDALTTGQDVSDLLGAILRIDVDRTSPGKPYAVPADNPFVDLPGARPEIWAYGLRNPWKFGVDHQTGNIFAADNGWESWEMVHRIVRGGNCGWPIMEGRAKLRTEVEPGPTPILPPIKDHSHSEANSVVGGPVYRGSKLPDLVGAFVYGDYITGTIWAIRADEKGAYSHQTLVDTDQRIVAFTEGSKGEIFVLDYDLTGQIYELLPSRTRDNSASFPRRLSETGLFTSVVTMEPAPGVVPYRVQVSPWMDGAMSDRWVAIPGDGRIELPRQADALGKYPDGTVLVKHLTLPLGGGREPLRLETQLLHYEDGTWRPYSYVWDESGQEATLVDAAGVNRPLQVPDVKSPSGFTERTWRVGAANECKLCHNAGPGFVLGFVANQLEIVSPGDSSGASQLADLGKRGVIAEAPRAAEALRLVDPHDRAQSLDDRARSYLHANCAMCHHPGGNAIVSFFLRRDVPFGKLNTNKGTGIGTFGIQDARIIAPGEPHRSLLLYRMAKLGYARMPYVGSRVVDSAGVALVEEWIGSLADKLTQSGFVQPEHEQTIRSQLSRTETALALAVNIHRAKLPPEFSRTAAALGSRAASSDVRGLFETFIPESERRPTLGPRFDPQIVLAAAGDVERGKLIFYSDGARCRACHEIDDRSQSLGPTLQEINRKYQQPGELLEHVVNPSAKIEDAFAAYVAETTDGQTHSGLLVEQTEAEAVLKTAERKVVRLARKDIESIARSSKSLMPDMVLSDLTAQEAADLLAYIRSVGAAEPTGK